MGQSGNVLMRRRGESREITLHCILFFVVAVSVFAGCSTPESPKSIAEEVPTPTVEPIVAERIDGPANIRDTINGKVLFTLYDGALVSNCSTLENDWYRVGVFADIDTSEIRMDSMVTGRKIIVDGKEVGEVVAAHEISTSYGGVRAWAELIGYTHKNNIAPSTIIEPALEKEMRDLQGERTLEAWVPFIQRFALERDKDFLGYDIYFNYENSLDDPSPGFRIGLVFDSEKLVALIHSRSLVLPGTHDNDLNGAFDLLTCTDFSKANTFIADVREWMQTVD